MSMRRVLVWGSLVVGLLVLPSVARAAPADVQKAFDQFLRSITDDPKTSAPFLTGCQLAILPAADGVSLAPRGLTATDLVGAHSGAITWKAHYVKAATNPAYHSTGWIAADVDAIDASKKVVKTLRVSALLNKPEKQWLVIAAHFGSPLADKDAAERALAGKAPQVKVIPDQILSDSPDKDAAAHLDDVRNLDTQTLSEMMGLEDAVLVGSAPHEVVQGGAAGQKTIAGWKTALATDGGVLLGSPPGDSGAFWLAANVTAKSKYKGKDVTQTYRALFIYQINVMGEGGNIYVDLILAHFSSPL
jgi:hypothetical protein